MAAKILLVEDDNNLREIYDARLEAEGYTIVTAKDGEEALVVAKAEKPDLIVSDVMMPRISGFEMLDILRNTAELKDTRVIMLTALGQADDQTRATSLGADRYLVKSQVTLEDIVKAAHDLIEGPAAAAPAPASPTIPPAPTPPPVATLAAPIQPPQAPIPAPATPAAPGSVSTPSLPVHNEPVVQPPVHSEPPTPAQLPATPTAPPAPQFQPVPQPLAVPPAQENAVGQAMKTAPASPTIPPAPAPPPVAPAPTPAQLPATPTAQTPEAEVKADALSAATEQTAIHTQIEDFINNNLTHPEAASQQSSLVAQTVASSPSQSPDDALLASAVNDLAGLKPAAPSVPDVHERPATPAALVPTLGPSAQPKPEGLPIPVNNPSVTIANKKIIQPLKSDKPGLDELLAREEAREQASSPSAPVAPFNAVPSSTPEMPPVGTPPAFSNPLMPSTPPQQPPSNGPDPNSIAL